jgi:8-oxo-dGTP pyrophosphatase MutT (NUDIX family)
MNSKYNTLLTNSNRLQRLVKKKIAAHTLKTYKYAETSFVRAAVLIPIFFKDGAAHILFTRRTDKVEHHKGQIAFPGGRHDIADGNLETTALRETWEEVGIARQDITIIGRTDDFLTNTHFMITPYLGFIPYPYSYTLNRDEIAEVYEVPLQLLLDPENFEVRPLVRDGVHWHLHYYHCNSLVIWGVTGFLVSNFLTIVFDLNRMDETGWFNV